MKKGDITTGTLVAIIVGVIVVAVFVYLVFFYGKESDLDCSLCKSKFTLWCSACSTTTPNPWGEVEMSNSLKQCIVECLEMTVTRNCVDYKDECKSYIPGLPD